ncbi:hypothetical protein [Streptomyces sp. ODS28]|uniref:hypothetical protein n=1 Tax=Streptomyces sp. ODS28 TaxID=3136688 RepID=UPI0031E55732
MSETQTETPGAAHSGRGKHRGPAASEESGGSTQGRHRRPAQDSGTAGAQEHGAAHHQSGNAA